MKPPRLHPKRLVLLCLVLAVSLAGLAALLLIGREEPAEQQPLTPITRDELLEVMDRRRIDELPEDERLARLAEEGARLSLLSHEERKRLFTDPECWRAFFALSGDERCAITIGGIFADALKEDGSMERFFEAEPEEQQKILDDRIDLTLTVSFANRMMQKTGVAPGPLEQRRQMRSSLARGGQEATKHFYRSLLDLSDSRQRAMFMEYRRRMIHRASQRGVDLVKVERGER